MLREPRRKGGPSYVSGGGLGGAGVGGRAGGLHSTQEARTVLGGQVGFSRQRWMGGGPRQQMLDGAGKCGRGETAETAQWFCAAGKDALCVLGQEKPRLWDRLGVRTWPNS